MSEPASLSPAVREQFQQTATQMGMSRIRFESNYWGNEMFGVWTEQVWAVVDEQSEKAFHLAIAYLGEPDDVIDPYDDNWHFDVWVPKSKADILVRPEWTTFEGDAPRKGTVYVALEKRDKYGPKVCLWGDTYEALSSDHADALDGHWDTLHHTFDGDNWVVDELNGIVISSITNAGYDVKISEGLNG